MAVVELPLPVPAAGQVRISTEAIGVGGADTLIRSGALADRETAKAMDADDFVVRNLTDQITAFTTVADTMRDRLSKLPTDEREEIEEASAVLRKVRATRDHKLLPLTVIRKDASDAC
ncbi:hypothetical protein [Streptomyces sp. enrichment culture]|uniref:hypothetical protein n=1 Tax=Streptomyces sp. enrichment culture TaxID=1795815 RepID=UPI003F56F933